MDRPEMRRRREEHDVGFGDDFVVGVEADEAMLFWDIDFLINVLLGKRFEAALEAVGEDVTHGDKLDVRIGVQCVRGCAGAASATTDETDAERFAGRDLRAGEGDGGAEGEGGFDEFATREDGIHKEIFNAKTQRSRDAKMDRC